MVALLSKRYLNSAVKIFETNHFSDFEDPQGRLVKET